MLLSEGSYFIIGGAGFIGSHFADALLASRQNPPRHHLRQLFLRPGVALRSASPAIRGSTSFMPTPATSAPSPPPWRATTGSSISPPIPTSRWPPSARRSTSTAAPCSPITWSRPCAAPACTVSSTPPAAASMATPATRPLTEDYAPMVPISTYGASKLACESLIASYCSMFGLHACVFRFGNVVGPRQTHGVGFDFLRSLSRQTQTSSHPRRRPAEQALHPRHRCR